MRHIIDWIERGWVPDPLVRMGIRQLNRRRLAHEGRGTIEARDQVRKRLIEQMNQGPIAEHVDKANIQHYELPPDFFTRILGRHLKYSACLWENGVDDLDQAELDMLAWLPVYAYLILATTLSVLTTTKKKLS